MVLQALEGLVGPGGDHRVAARRRLRAAVGRRGIPPHGAGVLAQPAASLGAAAADLRRGPPGGGADRGAHRAGPAGAGLHHLGGRGRHPGHGHPAGRGDPPGPPTGAGGLRDRAGRHDYDRPGKPACAWDDPRPPRRWCRGWSTTRWPYSKRSPTWSWVLSRPRQSRCWRWSPISFRSSVLDPRPGAQGPRPAPMTPQPAPGSWSSRWRHPPRRRWRRARRARPAPRDRWPW
jgi:hypothetical protein